MIKSQIKFLVVIAVVLGLSLAIKTANNHLQTTNNLLKADADSFAQAHFLITE